MPDALECRFFSRRVLVSLILSDLFGRCAPSGLSDGIGRGGFFGA